jgi:drug/metabolite transporter (DMT)-like permease
MSIDFLPRVCILASALLFSTGGMAVKSCGLSEWQIASFRCGIAAVVMLLLLPSARRWPTKRSLLVGVAYAATLILYVLANKSTTAINATFLQATAPIYIVLCGPWLLGERTHRRDLALMALMAVGMVFLLVGKVDVSGVALAPMRGNLYGAMAGVCWALTIMGMRSLERGTSTSTSTEEGAVGAVVAGNAIAFFGALPLALPVVEGTPADWLWVGYLGIFQVAVAYLLLAAGMRKVPAFEASMLLLLEPVFSPLWAYWVHGEVPRGGILLGALVVLLATGLKPLLDHRAAHSAGKFDAPDPATS